MAGRRRRRGNGTAAPGRERAPRRAAEDPDAPPEALDDPEQTARTVALSKLAAQPRTRAELGAAIARKGVSDEVADQVLDRLGEVGLVDDRAFADAWVESRHSGRGLARRALAHELRRRGVGDEDVDHAVEQVSGDDELATARRLVDRKLAAQPGLRRLDRVTQVRRLVSLLARKGYSAGLAARVVKEALSEIPPDDGGPDDLAEIVAPLENAED